MKSKARSRRGSATDSMRTSRRLRVSPISQASICAAPWRPRPIASITVVGPVT
jgi:hypothetical protein